MEQRKESQPSGIDRRKFIGTLGAAGLTTTGIVIALRALFSSKEPEIKEEKVTPESLAREILTEPNLKKARSQGGVRGGQGMPGEEVLRFRHELESLVSAGLQEAGLEKELLFVTWPEPLDKPTMVRWQLRPKHARQRSGQAPVKM